MIKSATRRFANRRAEMSFSCESFNKDGMNSARRVLDKALVEEAVKAMNEPDPEVDYFMVEIRVWDDWDQPNWDVEGVYEDYQDAALAAKTCGGNISITDRSEYDYYQMSNRQWMVDHGCDWWK